MTDVAMSEPSWPTTSSTFLSPTRADLSDLAVIMRTHPIGCKPGIPYYVEENDGIPLATTRATDIEHIASFALGEPIPLETREQAAAYEMLPNELRLYRRKDVSVS